MATSFSVIKSLSIFSLYPNKFLSLKSASCAFLDHVLRYQDDDRVKMIVLLGEVGGEEEYKIVHALENGRITKPLIAWCIGT